MTTILSRSSESKKAPPPPAPGRKDSPSRVRNSSPTPTTRKEGGGFAGFTRKSSSAPLPPSPSPATNNVPKMSGSPPKASVITTNFPSSPDGPVLRPSINSVNNSELANFRSSVNLPSPVLSSSASNPLPERIELTTRRPSEPTLRPSSSSADFDAARPPSRLSITNLTQKFPQVMEQLENNVVLLSRIIVHIKKVVATREAFSLALAKEWGAMLPRAKAPVNASVPIKKAPDTTPNRIRSISQTGRLSSSPAPPPFTTPSPVPKRNPLPLLLQKMEAMAETEGAQVANFCLQCKVAVIGPLERLRDAMEESKRKIEREEKERRLKFDEIKMKDELHRRKQKCLALWVNLQGMHKNRADAKKIQKFLVVIKGKFVKYQHMVNSFNATCETYYNAVPILFQSVQKLEYERIDTMRNVLRQYTTLWHQLYAEPAREAEAMLMLLDDPLASGSDQKDQWMEVLSQQQPAAKNWDGSIKSSEIPIVTFDLPCCPEELIPGFGTDPTRGPYVHKFDGVLRAALQAQQKENVTARKFSVDEDQRRVAQHFDKLSDDEVETKHADGDAETADGEEKGGNEDPAQGDLALAIYKQMFGCEPGELGHPILAESGEDESSSSSEEEDDDD